MSGPKRARIRQLPASRVAAARAGVVRAIADCSLTQGNGLQEVIADAEKWLSSLRQQSAEWRKPSKAESMSVPTSSDIRTLDRMREDLSLSVANEQGTCESLVKAQLAARSAAEAAQQVLRKTGSTADRFASVEAELYRTASEVDRLRRLADQAKRRIERQRAEIEAYYSHAVATKSPKKTAKPADDACGANAKAEAAARDAARAKLSQQLAELSHAPKSGWDDVKKWQGNAKSVDELQGLLRSAEQLLKKDDVAATEAAIEKAVMCREEIERIADTNREAAERLRSVADAVMQALCDRNYDTPVFGAIQDGDPLSGIQIRADVPSSDGRGNIRIELHADGRADFEVENVPSGEEEVCRDVIGGLAEAVASEGMELDVVDWGRAGPETVKEVQTLKKSEQVRQRVRGKSDVRPDGHGGKT